MAMNEELQSSAMRRDNRAKEDLQSLNEELNRVNSRLKDDVQRLESLHNGLVDRLSSERRCFEEALQSSNRELETFTLAVTRELKEPLRHIRGFTEAVLDDYVTKLDDDGQSMLRIIHDAACRMGSMMNGLLAVSRVMSQDMEPLSFDLSQLAESIVRSLREAEPERQVSVTIADGLGVVADWNMTRLALRHLLENAWKFTARNPSAQIEFGQTTSRNGPAYFVRDNGAGFDMELADRLFQPFQRLHDHDEFPGHGIGLATTHRVIQRHGGDVWAQAEAGKGSTIYFTIGEPSIWQMPIGVAPERPE